MATVETLIGDARGFASEVQNEATSTLQSVRDNINDIEGGLLGFVFPVMPNSPALPDEIEAPQLEPIQFVLPTEPGGVPVFQDIGSLDARQVPALTAVMPAITLPARPTEVAEFTAQLPGLETEANFPDAPVLDITFTAPAIADRAAPERPQVVLPSFDAQAPGDLEAAPTDYADRFVAAYRDAAPQMVATMEGYLDAQLAKINPQFAPQMAAIEAQLTRYLQGGTGFSPAVEAAIHERARGRNNAEYLRTRSAAYQDAARRGHTLPDGVLNANLIAARQGAANNNAAANREIVAQAAEMEQRNLQFAVTTSMALRQAVLSASLSYHSNLVQLNGQALGFAQSLLQALVQVYDSVVKGFQARADVYRSHAVVYETKLKAAMAAVDLYRAEIQALEALTNVDRSRIEVYKARIDSQQALANVYRSQIDSIVARFGVERLKVEIFQAQVQAYGARVQAKQAEYSGYRAAIDGEQAKAQLFSEQVRADLSRVQAWETEIRGKSEVVRAQALTNEARARQHAATLDAYRTVVGARGDVARTQLENQRQEILAFQATSQAKVAWAQLQNDYYRAAAEVIVKNAQLGVTTVLQTSAQNIARTQAVAQAGIGVAQVYANVAGSALAGMNTLVSQTLTE